MTAALTKPKTVDVSVHTRTESVVYRYEEQPDGGLRLIGVVNADDSVGPVPPPPAFESPFYADGRPKNPTVPATDTLFVAPAELRTQTEEYLDRVHGGK